VRISPTAIRVVNAIATRGVLRLLKRPKDESSTSSFARVKGQSGTGKDREGRGRALLELDCRQKPAPVRSPR